MKTVTDKREERLLGLLAECSSLISIMREQYIEQAGMEMRGYSDEEEWYLARLEEAQGFVKKAQFAVRRSNFKIDHEV